jgi:Fe-S cluster assembly protein SufD
MSVVVQQNFTQQFLKELSATSPKAGFTPFDKIATALQLLEEKGIPNNKWEEYKYCNIEAVLRKEFKSLHPASENFDFSRLENFISDESALNIFIVNGKVVKIAASKNRNLLIEKLEELSEEGNKIFENHFGKNTQDNPDTLIALNTAYCGNGILIRAEKNAVIEQPIHLINVSTSEKDCVNHFRKMIVLGENAQLQLHESYFSISEGGKTFNNEVSEIFIEENAIMHYNVLQSEDNSGYKVCNTYVQQESNSNFKINTFTFGGSLVRNNLSIRVNGSHAETHLNGLTLANEQQLIDHHTLVDHAVPDCVSNELYKGIASGKSNLIFNGKIFVRRDSQKINAYQSSKNILLSDDATINTKPQLEIFANDVKCSHGTSTGKVDEEALFYLKSRGIGETSARKLLLKAFAGEVVEKIESESFRLEVEKYLEDKIAIND